MKDCLISLSDLKFSYKNNLVLDCVSGNFREGEIYLLVGENGSGKSTFLKIILQALKSYEGKVAINANSYGMVGTVNFCDDLSGRDNAEYFLCSFSNKLFDEYITAFNMESYIDKKVKKYSLGMRQRLASVIVLLSQAKILLFDEPTNGMDYIAKNTFCNIIQRKKEENNCIIIATHNVNDFIDIVDRGVIIKNNKFYTKELDNRKKYEIVFEAHVDLREVLKKIETDFYCMAESSIIVNSEKSSISNIIRKICEFDIVKIVEYKMSAEEILQNVEK